MHLSHDSLIHRGSCLVRLTFDTVSASKINIPLRTFENGIPMYFEILIKLYSVNLESYEKKNFYLVSSIKTDVNSLLFIIFPFY